MPGALSRFGRWALGLYGPAVPDDLRLTDTEILDTGHTEVRPRVQLPADRARRLAARQERQHARLNELQHFVGETEIEQIERGQP